MDGADADEGGLIGSVDDPGSASVGVYDNIARVSSLSAGHLQDDCASRGQWGVIAVRVRACVRALALLGCFCWAVARF